MDVDAFVKTCGVERKGTNSLKWDALEDTFGADGLTPLWLADMEYKTVPEVREALQKKIDHGAFGYGITPDSYFEGFFGWQKRRHNMDIKREEVRFGSGIVGVLYAMVNAFTKPGDYVAICTPVYYPFMDAIVNPGRNIAEVELDNNKGRYTLDLAKFEKVISDNKAKMFILCSPHNPVSRVWTEAELEGMFSICRKHQVLVVSDEIHQDFVSPGYTFIPSCNVSGGAYKDMLITLNSASKTFNLACMIMSHTIIYNEKLREQYDAYLKTVGGSEANVFGMISYEAAFRHGDQWLDDLQKVIQQNYEYVRDTLAAKLPKAVVTPLEGTYLVWVDLRSYMADPTQTTDCMHEKCHLATDCGEWFYINEEDGMGFIRITLATLPKYVKEGVDSIVAQLG
jgi:cystathionine beta-lyase